MREELDEKVYQLYRQIWGISDMVLARAAIDLIRAETLEEAAVRLDREWPGPASSIVRALKGDT